MEVLNKVMASIRFNGDIAPFPLLNLSVILYFYIYYYISGKG